MTKKDRKRIRKWHKIIKESGKFDKVYYLKQNPDVRKNWDDPIEHYLLYGAKEGRDPNAWFDSDFYLAIYSDVRESGINPFVHYLLYGMQEGRACKKDAVGNENKSLQTAKRMQAKPVGREWTKAEKESYRIIHDSGLFDEGWYLDMYEEARRDPRGGLEHYIEIGQYQGNNPTNWFDSSYYVKTHPDVEENGINPFAHYILQAREKDRFAKVFGKSVECETNCEREWTIEEKEAYHILKKSKAFDPKWYQDTYKKSKNDHRGVLEYYIEKGQYCGDNPTEWFDVNIYLEQFPKLRELGVEPLKHFLTEGRKKGYVPFRYDYGREDYSKIAKSGLFLEEWVLEKYPDLNGVDDPLFHYCMYGYKEGWNPNPFFDTKWYRNRYGLNEATNPLLHYITEGWRKGYHPSYKFDVNKYLETYPEVKKNGLEPLKHFLTEGRKKGYVPFRYDYGREDYSKIAKSGLFLEEWVLEKYPDLNGVDDPLFHFCINGYNEDRNPNPFFDTKWYRNRYGLNEATNPLLHYITEGWRKGYHPSYKFDVNKYLETYPEVKKNGLEPLKHFLTEGRKKGYKIIGMPLTGKQVVVDRKASIIKNNFPYYERFMKFDDFKNLEIKEKTFCKNNMKISFIIPDFAIGGGGHMTIFRMIKYLEWFGHDITIYIFEPNVHHSTEDAYDDIIKHYQTIRAEVLFLDENFPEESHGDVIFATSWDTVWPVMSSKHFKRRFYLVQDYEPYFYSVGSLSNLAEFTYNLDIDTICASPWLEMKMKSHGRWAKSFFLAADNHIFYPIRDKVENKIPRIAFYARYFTSRRGVEIGLMALEILAEEGVEFHVDFYGAYLEIDKAPYSATEHGVKSPEYLADLYRETDLGIVFSLTNYSLVPQEMMSCGLPIIEFDTESTRSIYPEDIVTFAGPDPRDVADKIKKLLFNKNMRESQAKKALKWVRSFSWEESAKIINDSIVERLGELHFDAKICKNDKNIKCSVVIPTYNAGDLFKEIMIKVLSQNTPWRYEVVIIDSSSTDGTWEYLNSLNDSRLKLHQISQEEFCHGTTRNYGVKLSRGEYVAFLTQDSIPFDEFWLYNLVTPLEHYKEAAGTFGKHIAHDNATFFTKEEINAHFDQYDNMPLCLYKDLNKDRYKNDISWRQKMHFYSDNNSCLRKSIWNKIPYRDVKYGEDNLWAKDIIENGYKKLYSPKAIVKHSHDYTPEETYERAKIDGDYFKYFWGYKLMDREDIEKTLKLYYKNDSITALENGLSTNELEYRMQVLRARFEGWVDGYYKTPSLFDENNNEKSKF